MAIRQIDPFGAGIRVVVTDRFGGASRGPYARFNLGDHVGDSPAAVGANRLRFERSLGRPVQWARQVHGRRIVPIDAIGEPPEADGLMTTAPGVALGILTADCYPIVIATRTRLVVLHCGWRGASNGLIEDALERLGDEAFAVWIGPGISGGCYEVDAALWANLDAEDRACIRPGRTGRGFLDIAAMIDRRTRGARLVSRDGRCTFKDRALYSHRRTTAEHSGNAGEAAPVTGRFATIAWIDDRTSARLFDSER